MMAYKSRRACKENLHVSSVHKIIRIGMRDMDRLVGEFQAAAK
jgi:hypothetical protein